MTEGVDLPCHARASASAESAVEESEAEGHLIDHGVVMSSGLVVHAPAPQDEFEPPWRKSNNRNYCVFLWIKTNQSLAMYHYKEIETSQKLISHEKQQDTSHNRH